MFIEVAATAWEKQTSINERTCITPGLQPEHGSKNESGTQRVLINRREWIIEGMKKDGPCAHFLSGELGSSFKRWNGGQAAGPGARSTNSGRRNGR